MVEQEFEVEIILDKTIFKNETYYCIKWKGYNQPDWIHVNKLNCDKLIQKYEKSKEQTESYSSEESLSDMDSDDNLKIVSIHNIEGKLYTIIKRDEQWERVELIEISDKYPKQFCYFLIKLAEFR